LYRSHIFDIPKINVAEVRMLRWIGGDIWKDKIRNEAVCLKVRAAPIERANEKISLKTVWLCAMDTDPCTSRKDLFEFSWGSEKKKREIYRNMDRNREEGYVN